MKELLTSLKARRYLYTVLASAVPVLVFSGVFGPEEAQLYLALAAAVLALGGGATAVHYTGGTYTTHKVESGSEGYDPESDA